MPEVGQAKGGSNGFQLRIVRLKARVLYTTHTVVRNGDQHHFIIEVSRSVKADPRTPLTGCDHMDSALLSDWPDPTGAKPLISSGRPQVGQGFTRHGAPLAAGYTQEQYDNDMRKWKSNGGGRSEGEMEEAIRRSKELILSTFPKADRT